jgi:tyramine---L-glutamate ligase
VCEFITGGGLCGEQLPDSLAKEGALMRDALLRDLSELPYEIITTIDARVNNDALQTNIHAGCRAVSAKDNVWQIWQALISECDAVWLIAPETGGILKKLTQLASLESKLILGCGLDSIEITSSKIATYLALEKAGIASVPTYTFENWPKSHWIWLAKPNDGAGCDDIACFNNPDDLEEWVEDNDKQFTHVIQAYQPGDAASISCVMRHGKAHILSCNTQLIEINNQMLSYNGGVINGMRYYWPQFEFIANKIAQALPDLAGYVGIDVIVDDSEIFVVEINPRLTTSYIGLRESIAANPAELIINTLTDADFVWPTLQRNLVNIEL